MGPAEPPTPYQAPRAEPAAVDPDAGLTPSLEDAIAGRYDFTVDDVMSEAWALVKGMKASFWGAGIVVALIYIVLETILSIAISPFISDKPNVVVKQGFNLVVGALLTPITMGMSMMCVRRALGHPISFGTAFSYLHRGGTAIVGAFLVLLLQGLGLLFLIIPGIYLIVAYHLTIQLICDRQLGAWQAMEISRKAITHHWWGVLGLTLLVGLLTLLSALGLLIPLIWTIPWSFMATAVLYRRIFYARQT
jgi:hypothetical protein